MYNEIVYDELNRLKISNIIKYENRELVFVFNNGVILTMKHIQNCCEEVEISEINDNYKNFLNSTIIEFKEITEERNNIEWTFYKIKTSFGYLDITWQGESDSYLCSVDVGISEPLIPNLLDKKIAFINLEKAMNLNIVKKVFDKVIDDKFEYIIVDKPMDYSSMINEVVYENFGKRVLYFDLDALKYDYIFRSIPSENLTCLLFSLDNSHYDNMKQIYYFHYLTQKLYVGDYDYLLNVFGVSYLLEKYRADDAIESLDFRIDNENNRLLVKFLDDVSHYVIVKNGIIEKYNTNNVSFNTEGNLDGFYLYDIVKDNKCNSYLLFELNEELLIVELVDKNNTNLGIKSILMNNRRLLSSMDKFR